MIFLDKNFLLQTETAKVLYHDYAAGMPILDYHCHLSPEEIWKNEAYENIGQVWLGADHYKWRAMRSNGIREEKITGDANWRDKFQAWAETVPYCLGNPLYHWTHLELQRFFEIHETLDGQSAESIWQQCNNKLSDLRPRDCISKSQVELICTTDDPCDSLEYHQKIQASSEIAFRVLPTFRPDMAVNIEHKGFGTWLEKLSDIVGYGVDSVAKLKQALNKRMDFFATCGCILSDHGMDKIYFEKASDRELETIIQKKLCARELSQKEVAQYKTALWSFLGMEYAKRGWVMQLHIGAQRDNNSRMLAKLGPNSGFDSIGDAPVAQPLAQFLDCLDSCDLLPKTVLYTLNARDNDVLATMTGNFQGSVAGKSLAGKMQFGSGWWFHDQRDGMEAQMRSLANLGLLSRFIGMLTDSRSFLSFPRHEYFRRILCNLIGTWVENGEYPADEQRLGQIVQNICYYNAQKYLSKAYLDL